MCEYDTTTSVRQWLYTGPKFICLMTTVLLVVLFSTLLTRDPLVDSEATTLLANVLNDVTKQAINHIKMPIDSVCPDGYEISNLARWEGTVEGCIDSLGYLDRGRCPQRVKTYTAVPAVKPKNFYVWNSNSFCVKKTKTLTVLSNGKKCPSNLVPCSNDTCINPSEECPIVNLKIVANDTELLGNYHNVSLNATTILIYQHSSSNNTGDFITKLNISLYGTPCINPNNKPEPKSAHPYDLAPTPNLGCGKFGPIQTFEYLDSLPLHTVFTQNGIDSTVRNKLPEFEQYISGEESVFVGLKRYSILNTPACGTIGPDIVTRLTAHEINFTNSLWAVAITLLLVTLVLFVSIPLETYLRFRDYEEEKVLLKLVAYLNIGLLGFLFFMYIVKGLITINARTDIDPEYFYLKNLANNECFQQPEINSILQVFIGEMASDIYVIFALNITLAGLAVVGFLMLVMLTLADIIQVRKNRQAQYAYSNRNIRKRNNNDNIEMLLKNQH